MLSTFKNGQGSIVLRAKLLDSTSATGAGLTGLTSGSSGLIISTIADNEASATAYTVAGSTVESITTLGTFAAPTATKCRFKEVDATNHKGIYEFQFADARFAVANAKSLLVSVAGATNLQQADFVVQLQADDPYVAKPANSASLSIDGSGRVDVAKIGGTSQTAGDIFARLGAPAGASVSADVAAVKALLPAALVSGRIDASVGAMASGVLTATAIGADAITAAKIADGAIDAATFATGAITAAAIAPDAIGASELAADAVTEIQSGLATAASIAALNNLSAAQVNAEVDTAIADVGLTTTITGRIDAAISTRLASSSYAAPLDAAGTRTAVGLASANLDTQLSAIAGFVDTEVAAILAAVDTEVGAIKAKTDSLTFTVAGKVDSNIRHVNGTAVTGNGASGTEWGPA